MPRAIPFNSQCGSVCKDAYAHLTACSEYSDIGNYGLVDPIVADVPCVCTPEQVTKMRACTDYQGAYLGGEPLPLNWLYFCKSGHIDVLMTSSISAFFST